MHPGPVVWVVPPHAGAEEASADQWGPGDSGGCDARGARIELKARVRKAGHCWAAYALAVLGWAARAGREWERERERWAGGGWGFGLDWEAGWAGLLLLLFFFSFSSQLKTI